MKPTTKPTDMGANRTGVAASPSDAKKLVEGARQGSPAPTYDLQPLEVIRLAYNEDAEPLGTVPPPASLKGAVKATVKALAGEKATVLIDQMAGRLAFERTGTRLYEALLTKLQAADVHAGGPTVDELREIHDEELAHVALLADGLERLGADPTSMTPNADLQAVASAGILGVLVDARTTLTQSLEAILSAELTDNEAWSLLVTLAEKMGQDTLAAEFREALLQEEEHLARVRTWLQTSLEGQAGVADKAPAAPTPAAPTPLA